MKAHLAPDSSAVTATADTSNRSISTSAYFPSVVRIKRKRDEPVLPGFVLSSKRPSLANLSLGGNDEYESQQPLAQPQEQQSQGARPLDGQAPRCDPPPPSKKSTRFRFAGTVPAGAGSCSNSSSTTTSATVTIGTSMAAAQTFAREVTVRRKQTDARIRAVNIRRSSSTDATGAVQHMLELRRCASSSALDELDSGKSAVPKLRPFGPPLPPAPRAAGHASRPSMPPDEALLEDIWRDAAVASQMATEEMAAEESDEFVYDEYTIAPADGDADASGVDGVPAFESEPELWWDELDEETVHSLVGGGPEIGSDSEGSLDYPEEEEQSCEDASDDDYCR